MIIDVHVAFMFAAISVVIGVTYTLGNFLDRQTKRAQEKRTERGFPSESTPTLEA